MAKLESPTSGAEEGKMSDGVDAQEFISGGGEL